MSTINLSDVQAFVAMLFATERYDDAQGLSYWMDGDQRVGVTCCTNSARMIARKFGGVIRGYACQSTEDPRIGAWSFGHDFAVVGDYLVDYWARFVDESVERAVLHLRDDAELIARLYGSTEMWEAARI